MVTMPAYLDFFVKNYNDIQSVVALDREARRILPSKVTEMIHSAIKQAAGQGGWGGLQRIKTYHEEGDVNWWDASWYEDKTDYGLFFGVAGISEDTILEPVGSERPYFYLYFNSGRKQRVADIFKRDLVKQGIEQARESLEAKDHMLYARDDDENYLAWKSLGETLTIDALSDRNTAIEDFLAKAKAFTETFAPIVYQSSRSG